MQRMGYAARIIAIHTAAAQRAGLKVAYIPRPAENGPGGAMEPVGDTVFDVQAPSLEALAGALGLA